MITTNAIRHQTVGDGGIDTDNFNKMVDTANKFANLSIASNTIDYILDDGVNKKIVLSPGTTTTTDTTDWAFGCSVDSAGLVTVNEGTFEAHGAAKIDNPQTTIQLTGGPYEYVYVSWIRGSADISIIHATSVPTSDGTTIYVPLAKFELTASPHTYSKVLIKHQGDINFDVPLA